MVVERIETDGYDGLSLVFAEHGCWSTGSKYFGLGGYTMGAEIPVHMYVFGKGKELM